MKSSYWERGEQGKLAHLAGLSPQYLNGILHRTRGCGRVMAKRLSAVAKAIKKDIPLEDFLFNRESYHPAFYGVPKLR